MLKNMIKNLIDQLDGDAGIVVKNMKTGESFMFHEDILFPSASIIKLPILWKLFKKIEAKQAALKDIILLQDQDKVGGFGILKELHSGLNLSIKDLATLMIILSDNVATNILIDLLGMEAINDSCKDMGLNATILQRKMMDAEAKKKGLDNFTSPRDILCILENFLTSEDLTNESKIEILDILKKQQCNNKLPVFIDSNVAFAHKTGDLPGVEHDAGILFLEDKPIIIVVLTKNLKDNMEGIKFNNEIGKMVYNYFK